MSILIILVCCPLVSHVEYAPRNLLRLEKDGTDRRTDGRTVERTPDRYTTLTRIPLDGARQRNKGKTSCLLPDGATYVIKSMQVVITDMLKTKRISILPTIVQIGSGVLRQSNAVTPFLGHHIYGLSGPSLCFSLRLS